MPSADEQHNEHNQSEKETAENLLANEFHLYASSIGKLYKNMMRISMKGPWKAGGKGSNGLDDRIADTAARSKGSFPEPISRDGSSLGTLPFAMILNLSKTRPRSPSNADCGITAYQFRRTFSSMRCM